MADNLDTVPLAALSRESRSLLSELLNPKKVLPIIGPDQLSRHRDWRGLASLLNISTEKAASINDYPDKTAKVLQIWENSNDGTATVGRLLNYLQILDRYDVHDDILEWARDNKLLAYSNALDINQYQPINVDYKSMDGFGEELITFDDRLFGRPQKYHAYVLYGEQDKPFVDEVLYRMRSEGFKMCTEEDLRAGHTTKFEPVSRLITERCRYIVLILSPDFVRSRANQFFMNLAQADAINKQQIKIIPIMYRPCKLPSHIAHYHSLRYHAPTLNERYSFWDKLSQSLLTLDTPRVKNGKSSSYSSVNIAELSKSIFSNAQLNGFNSLALPEVPRDASSLNDLHTLRIDLPDSYETKSLSDSNQSKNSKKSTFRKLFNTIKGKKHKKAIANCN